MSALGTNFLRTTDGTVYALADLAEGQGWVKIGGSLQPLALMSTDIGDFDGGFARLGVASPSTLFESNHIGGAADVRQWQFDATGSATSTHDEEESSVTLTATAGDRIVMQTYQYVPYQPGKLQQVLFTGVLDLTDPIPAGAYVRYGNYDEQGDKTPVSTFDDTGDGHFFQVDSTGLSVVERRTVSGTETDDSVAQASWNMDKLDGTGASGYTIDETKTHVFFIQRQWLGVGSVDMGVFVDDQRIVCHRFSHDNVLDRTYCKMASLPMRMEANAVSAASSCECKQICSTVISLGGTEKQGAVRVTSRQVTITGTEHIFTIRLKSDHNRWSVYPVRLTVGATGFGNGDAAQVTALLNGTPSGALTWTSASPAVEVATNNVTFTGGVTLYTRYFTNTDGSADMIPNNKALPLSSSIDGTQQTLTIILTEIGTLGTGFVTLTWEELI